MQFKILLCCKHGKLRPSTKLISLLLPRVPINNSNHYCTVDYLIELILNPVKETNYIITLY